MTVHRYHRQTLLEGIGTEGQERLRSASVLVAGVGALGCAVADHLVRAGIGHLRLIDRDLVEPTNLQRQCLFAEDDVGSPKAAAAAARLQAINHEVQLDVVVDDLRPAVANDMIAGCDAIADGLDNFATRFLLNDLSVKFGLPYAYGGAVGYEGTAALLRPSPKHRKQRITREISERESGPCLRCLVPEAPPAHHTPTCDTAGVLAPVVAVVAGLQAAALIQYLAHSDQPVPHVLTRFDARAMRMHQLDISGSRREDCSTCTQGQFDELETTNGNQATTVCGRDLIQLLPPEPKATDLDALHQRLSDHGSFERQPFLLRGTLDAEFDGEGKPIGLTVFSDGRVFVHGIVDVTQARAVNNRWLGG